MDPTERSLKMRMAAHLSWAKTSDRAARTAPARDALMARFERQVDPDGVLPAEERRQRAASARKAHFAQLALRSAEKRRLDREAKQKEQAQKRERELARLERKVDPHGVLPAKERRLRAEAAHSAAASVRGTGRAAA